MRLYILKKLFIRYSKQDHCFFRSAPSIPKKPLIFTQVFWVISGKSKQKKQIQHATHFKMQGVPPKKQYHCFFRKAPKISRKNKFYTRNLSGQWQMKIEKKSRDYTFSKCLHTWCSTENATAFFAENLIFQEKNHFYRSNLREWQQIGIEKP